MAKVRVPVLVLVAAVALGTVVGCGDDADDVTKANEAYCTAVTQVRSEIAEFQQMLAGDATRDELSIQADSVRSAAINAILDAQDLAEVIDQELQDAGTQFADSLEALDDEAATPEQAKAEAGSAAQAYLAEVEATATEVGCPAS